jgi:cell division protein FtsX
MKSNSLRVALLFVVTFSILSMISGFLIYKNTLLLLGAWSNSNKLQAFFKVDTGEKEINDLIQNLKTDRNVADVVRVDRKKAGTEFQKSLKQFASGLLSEDELIDLIPETIEVELVPVSDISIRTERVQKLAESLTATGLIEDVSYSSSWLKRFEKVDRFLKNFGFFIFLVLLTITSYLVSLMMRVYIDDSRNEIEVYNMLGATKWMILKLYMKDLFSFLSISLAASLGISFAFFYYIKSALLQNSILPQLAGALQFINFTEGLVLFGILILVFVLHSAMTISQAVNQLNQIQND